MACKSAPTWPCLRLRDHASLPWRARGDGVMIHTGLLSVPRVAVRCGFEGQGIDLAGAVTIRATSSNFGNSTSTIAVAETVFGARPAQQVS